MLDVAASDETHPLIRWLMTDARKPAHPSEFLEAIAERLRHTRLDFTVIGPAVNLIARIELMYRELGRQLLLSSDFLKAGGAAAQSVGTFSLKGVGTDQEIFVPVPG